MLDENERNRRAVAQETTAGSAGAPPRRSDVGVLAIVPDTWGAAWQVRQHVLTRLAEYFHVVWMDPAPHWRNALGYAAKRRKPASERVPPGFLVYQPEIWLPLFYRPEAVGSLTRRARLQRGISLLRRRGCRKIILYLWRPEFAHALDLAGWDLTCYHIDDEYSFGNEDAPISESEITLLRRVDQVFIHSPGLLERKGRLNPHTCCVPNGVDYELFSTPHDEPADLRPIPHPRIGYHGFIKKQLDWQLLKALAKKRPEWSFVFVGPCSPHPGIQAVLDEMKTLANVRFLGARAWREVAAYAQHFDVCIMPYDRSGGFAKYILPLKLHEYLATGRPVAGARIPSLEPFEDVVSLAACTEEWISAIERSLRPAALAPEACDRRRAVAQRYDWNLLVGRIARTLASRLDGSESADVTLIEENAQVR